MSDPLFDESLVLDPDEQAGGSEAGYLFPLSFPQQQLWLAVELAGETPAFNIPLAFELEGRKVTGRLEVSPKSGRHQFVSS